MTSNSRARDDYIARINRVIDHIYANLDKEITLVELAKVAAFSPYHFHRIFGAMVGESLFRFIARLRVEKAANRLLLSPKQSVTEIALDCGFSSSAVFARQFKDRFGMSATEWRDTGGSKDCKTSSNDPDAKRKLQEDAAAISVYLDSSTSNLKWRVEMSGTKEIKADVTVKDLPEMPAVYVRHTGPYAGDEKLFAGLFGKLMQFAGPRGLFQPPKSQFITIYHDDPSVTDDDKLRISCCLTTDQDVEVDGDIGKITIAGGKYGIARFEIDADQYGQAWEAVYKGWLPESGYMPDDRPCFELYLNDPKEHPEGKHIVEICVPVRPA